MLHINRLASLFFQFLRSTAGLNFLSQLQLQRERRMVTSLRRGRATLAAVAVAFLVAVGEVQSAAVPQQKIVMHPAFKDAGRKEGLLVWRIQNFEPVAVPASDYGKFFSGDSYIVLNTKEDKSKKGTFTWDIHFWLGEKTSQDESGAAAILSVELDDGLGGGPVQHREVQAHESQLFLSYFKSGVRYVPGGVASGFHHAETNAPGEKRLYQVKGKKNIRVRMVELNVKSMNKGDCFILDSGTEIYVYVGSKAKGTERLKAVSAANQIRDQDHAGRAHVTIIDSSSTETEIKKFFTELGSGSEAQIPDESAGGDDQEFEKNQEAVVTLYKVSDDGGTLKSDKIAQKPLKQSMLNTGDSFILDTATSGIYVWVGKKSTTQEKVEALKLGQLYITSKKYPAWTKLVRVVENAEPSAFREYFSEWRDSQILGGIGRGGGGSRRARSATRKCGPVPDFMPDDGTGKVDIFRVENFDLVEVPESTHGMFFGGDSYVIRYTYTSGGQENYIIYFWLGNKSTLDERGTAAIMALKLDRDLGGKAIQIRITQGQEPAHFLRIFKGKMVVLMGGKASGFRNLKDHDTYDLDGTRLFQVMGTRADNVRAVQVEENASSLNTNDVFILETPNNCYLWIGQGSNQEEKVFAENIKGMVCGESEIIPLVEGEEPQDFWDALGGKTRYNTELVHEPSPAEPKLYHCYIEGSNYKCEEVPDFEQKDLYHDDVMILDTGDLYSYLWIGNDADPEEKLQALKSAKSYVERHCNTGVLITIKQGQEPESFKILFPKWDDNHWQSVKMYEELKNEIMTSGRETKFE